VHGGFHPRILYPSDGRKGLSGGHQKENYKQQKQMSLTGNIRKIFFISLWSMAGGGVLVLLVAAIKSRSSKACKGYEISINDGSGKSFINKKDLINMITDSGSEKLTGKTIASFNLQQMETKVEKNPWIKKAQLFFDNNEILRIHITVKEPVARIFTVGGNSFYIDSSGAQLPLSEKAVTKIPVFTDYPFEKIKTHGADSIMLQQIKKLSSYIFKDSFWMAEIEQVDITPSKTFEMIPVIGNHIIEFGDGNDCEKKFNRLFIFYKDVLSKTGFDKYSRINVAYAGQIIGTKKGSGITKADSLLAIKNIQQLIRSARQMQADTAKQQNVKPLENTTSNEQSAMNYDLVAENADSVQHIANPKSNPSLEKPKAKPVTVKPKPVVAQSKPPLKKPSPVKTNNKNQKPKAVMPKN
jgi:cell division protein FtsQ